jgi:hypothetical protein
MGKTQLLVTINLNYMKTKTSGDWGKTGEFYFITDSTRCPANKGVFRVFVEKNKENYFAPPFPIQLSSAIIANPKDILTFDIKMNEQDTFFDDTMLHQKITVDSKKKSQDITITEKKGIELNLTVHCEIIDGVL